MGDLAESKHRELFRFLDENLPDVAIVLDAGGQILHTSESVRRVGKWAPDELRGRSGLDLVHADDLDYAVGALLETADNPGEHGAVELRFLRGDGSYLPAEVQTYNDPSDPDGRIVVAIRDISLRSTLPERRRALERFVLKVGADCAGVSGDGLEGVMADVTKRLGELLEAHEVWLTAVSPDQSNLSSSRWVCEGEDPKLTAFAEVSELDAVARAVDHPGRIRVSLDSPVRALVDEPVLDDSGRPVGLLTICWHLPDARRYWDEGNHTLLEATARILTETSRRVLREDMLQHQALHDPLTGLGNRMRLLTALDHELSRTSGRASTGLALAFCDLDRFKAVNDNYGHAAGDELLVSIGGRLREAVRHGDLVCRVGGDEFVVLCPDVDTAELAETIGRRLYDEVASAVVVHDGVELAVSTSIGVVRLSGRPDQSLSADELVRMADQAMYEAKAQPGRGICRVDVELSPGLRATG